MTDEPTQPQKPTESEKGLLSGFGGLAGIDDAKDVQAREQTTLDKLLKLEEEIVGKHSSELPFTLDYYNTYNKVYEQLTKELGGFYFNEDDIIDFINANANIDHNTEYNIVLGMFTGGLLQILTERNLAQGKRTKIYINGQGKRFDYLFAYARVVDTLIIENFRGDNICKALGSYKGKVNQLVGVDINGNHIFNGIGSFNGRIEQMLCVGIKGDYALNNPCHHNGYCNQVLCVDSTSVDDAIFGNSLSLDNKNIAYINMMGVVGLKVRHDYLNSIESEHGGNGILINAEACYLEDIKLIPTIEGRRLAAIRSVNSYIRNRMSAFYFVDRGSEELNILFVDWDIIGVKDDSHNPYSKKRYIILGEEALKQYQRTVSEQKVDAIVKLARTIKGRPKEDIFRIADELYALRPQC